MSQKEFPKNLDGMKGDPVDLTKLTVEKVEQGRRLSNLPENLSDVLALLMPGELLCYIKSLGYNKKLFGTLGPDDWLKFNELVHTHRDRSRLDFYAVAVRTSNPEMKTERG